MHPVFYAPISVNRRIALAGKMAFDYMPIASLLSWRATCRDNYSLATIALRTSLDTLLLRFVPNPTTFLDYLSQWGALIVGEAALSQVLYDPSICKGTLELAVGNLVFDTFVRRIIRLLPYGTQVINCIQKPAPASFLFLRHITRIAEFYLPSGLVVHVYESCSSSACDVICGAWTTALMNFVTKSTFGCAYPRLTLNYCGILCDGRNDAKRWLDHSTHTHLQAKGFRLSPYSPTWDEYNLRPHSTSGVTDAGCGRAMHLCPNQGRFFGDAGSLIIFFDGFAANLKDLRDSYIAPYGIMTAWRIPTKETLECRCVQDPSVVPPFVVSILLSLVENGASAQHGTQNQKTCDSYAHPLRIHDSQLVHCGRRNSF